MLCALCSVLCALCSIYPLYVLPRPPVGASVFFEGKKKNGFVCCFYVCGFCFVSARTLVPAPLSRRSSRARLEGCSYGCSPVHSGQPGLSVGILGLADVSPCLGVRSVRGLLTLRVDVQPVDLLPSVGHLRRHIHFIFGRRSRSRPSRPPLWPSIVALDAPVSRTCDSKLRLHGSVGPCYHVMRAVLW